MATESWYLSLLCILSLFGFIEPRRPPPNKILGILLFGNIIFGIYHTLSSTVTHHGIWGLSPLLLMSLVDGRYVLPEPIGWLCVGLDCPPSVAELFPVAAAQIWNSLPEHIDSAPRCSLYYNSLSLFLPIAL